VNSEQMLSTTERQQIQRDIERFEREPTLQSVRQASALRKQLIDDAVKRSAAAMKGAAVGRKG